jgi:hypothetical protein
MHVEEERSIRHLGEPAFDPADERLRVEIDARPPVAALRVEAEHVEPAVEPEDRRAEIVRDERRRSPSPGPAGARRASGPPERRARDGPTAPCDPGSRPVRIEVIAGSVHELWAVAWVKRTAPPAKASMRGLVGLP